MERGEAAMIGDIDEWPFTAGEEVERIHGEPRKANARKILWAERIPCNRCFCLPVVIIGVAQAVERVVGRACDLQRQQQQQGRDI